MSDIIPINNSAIAHMAPEKPAPKKSNLPKISNMQQKTEMNEQTRCFEVKFRFVFEFTQMVDDRLFDDMPGAELPVSEDILRSLDHSIYGDVRHQLTRAMHELEGDIVYANSSSHFHICREGFTQLRDLVDQLLTIQD